MHILRDGQSNGTVEPIEISPEPNLYEVQFQFLAQHRGVSIVTAATCALAAKAKAWEFFPELKRDALRVSVHRVKYVEVDWRSGRTLGVKQERQPYILASKIEKLKTPRKRKKRNEGGAE
jgi:hypothetical protein